MSDFTISIDSRELSRFLNQLNRYSKEKQEAVKHEIARATYSIESRAKQNSPVDKGFLKNSVSAVIKNAQLTGQVIVKSKYGIFVHEGTKPHIITPKNKKVLAWRGVSYSSYGRRQYSPYSFAMMVRHPGTKGQPFLSKAADSERPIYQQNLINIFSR